MNVDFTRVWSRTTLLKEFCGKVNLYPVGKHSSCDVGYTYQFSMLRFNTLDNANGSGNLFATAVNKHAVLHGIDSTSDHGNGHYPGRLPPDIFPSLKRAVGHLPLPEKKRGGHLPLPDKKWADICPCRKNSERTFALP